MEAEEDVNLECSNERFTVKFNSLKEFEEVAEIVYLKKLFRKFKHDYLKGLAIKIVASMHMLRHRKFKIENSEEIKIFEDEYKFI